MSGKCLLVGNGLNRGLEGSIEWGELLSVIAEKYSVEYEKSIPMPMEFERIINEYLKKGSISETIYSDTKNEIARLIDIDLPESPVHQRLSHMTSLNSIITTNYDLLLEYAFDPAFIPVIRKGTRHLDKKDPDKRYLDKKVGSINGIDFYHAHGCVKDPATICLGYEHYMGIVSKQRDHLAAKNKEHNEIYIKLMLDGVKDWQGSWSELFFNSDISIIGLTLDVNESDLWWLLTYRASLYYRNHNGIKSKLQNRIDYYDVVDDVPKSDSDEESERIIKQGKKELKFKHLEGTHVNVKRYPLSKYGTYQNAYLQMLDDIDNME